MLITVSLEIAPRHVLSRCRRGCGSGLDNDVRVDLWSDQVMNVPTDNTGRLPWLKRMRVVALMRPRFGSTEYRFEESTGLANVP
jgi:hypothetical protein